MKVFLKVCVLFLMLGSFAVNAAEVSKLIKVVPVLHDPKKGWLALLFVEGQIGDLMKPNTSREGTIDKNMWSPLGVDVTGLSRQEAAKKIRDRFFDLCSFSRLTDENILNAVEIKSAGRTYYFVNVPYYDYDGWGDTVYINLALRNRSIVARLLKESDTPEKRAELLLPAVLKVEWPRIDELIKPATQGPIGAKRAQVDPVFKADLGEHLETIKAGLAKYMTKKSFELPAEFLTEEELAQRTSQ